MPPTTPALSTRPTPSRSRSNQGSNAAASGGEQAIVRGDRRGMGHEPDTGVG